jgi:Icc-related predicted phosphoesterase
MHGHIHESVGFRNIGRTLCINPGSEYREGILKGFVITIKDDEVNAGRVEL